MRHAALAFVLAAAALSACADATAPTAKRDERFDVRIAANPKADGAAPLLSDGETARLEAAFDAAIAAGERTIASLEAEIARLEQAAADKAREIDGLVQQIAARRAELERQYDNNLILCMFFPNPVTCVFANYLANDGRMRDYEARLAEARAAAQRATNDIAAYEARRDALRARLEPIRAGRLRLVALVRGGVEVGPAPAALAALPGLTPPVEAAWSRLEALGAIATATRAEIDVLIAIRNAAAELSAALDAAVATLRELVTSVDALVAEARESFMDLLAAALGGDPAAAVERWLEDELAALTRRTLDGLGWPLSEFVQHLVATHPASSDVDADDVLTALSEAPPGGEPDGDDPDAPALPEDLVLASSDALGIHDLTEAVSMLRVAAPYTASELELELHIRHTWRGDLRVWLEHPGLLPIALHERTGGGDDDLDLHVRLTFDGSLDVQGDWRLHVADEVALDEGELEAWRLTFRAR